MPVFDFSDAPVANEHPECTYETFHSTETKASADKPIVVIDNKQKEWAHHALGMFTNPIKRTSFEFEDGDGVTSADILRIDSRFVSLFKWLGENHIKVQTVKNMASMNMSVDVISQVTGLSQEEVKNILG